MLRIFKDDSLKFEYVPRVITRMRTGGLVTKILKIFLLRHLKTL